MKTIKRILLLCLVVVIVTTIIQIKGGYDKYKQALVNRPLVEVLGELQKNDNYTQYKDVSKMLLESTSFC